MVCFKQGPMDARVYHTRLRIHLEHRCSEPKGRQMGGCRDPPSENCSIPANHVHNHQREHFKSMEIIFRVLVCRISIAAYVCVTSLGDSHGSYGQGLPLPRSSASWRVGLFSFPLAPESASDFERQRSIEIFWVISHVHKA